MELNQSGLLRFAGPALGDGTPKMTLAGFPLYCVEACQPVGTQGDLILGDWSQLVIAEKVPQFPDSGEVRFIYHEHCFKLVVRLTSHSSWLGPVTSMNESTTTSPFVAIATRIGNHADDRISHRRCLPGDPLGVDEKNRTINGFIVSQKARLFPAAANSTVEIQRRIRRLIYTEPKGLKCGIGHP